LPGGIQSGHYIALPSIYTLVKTKQSILGVENVVKPESQGPKAELLLNASLAKCEKASDAGSAFVSFKWLDSMGCLEVEFVDLECVLDEVCVRSQVPPLYIRAQLRRCRSFCEFEQIAYDAAFVFWIHCFQYCFRCFQFFIDGYVIFELRHFLLHI